jgi:hypothetical protein
LNRNVVPEFLKCTISFTTTTRCLPWGKKEDEPGPSNLTTDAAITDRDDLEEIEKIAEMLNPNEEVYVVARQSRLKPGGSKLTPNVVFAHNNSTIDILFFDDTMTTKYTRIMISSRTYTNSSINDIAYYTDNNERRKKESSKARSGIK